MAITTITTDWKPVNGKSKFQQVGKEAKYKST